MHNICAIYTVFYFLFHLCYTHTHTNTCCGRKKSLLAVWSSWNAKQIRGNPVRSIMILTSHSHVGRGPNGGDGATEKAKWTFLNLVLFSVAVFVRVFPSWLDCSLLCSLNSFCLFFFQHRRLQLFRVYYYFVVQYEWHASLGRRRLRWVFSLPQKQTIVTSGQELWLEPFLLFLNTPPLPSHFHRTRCDCAEHTLIISQTFRHLRQLPDFFNSHTSLKARGGLSY